MGTHGQSLSFLGLCEKNSGSEDDGMITVDGINAEGWVVGQLWSSSCRVGLLPDTTATSVMAIFMLEMDTHN